MIWAHIAFGVCVAAIMVFWAHSRDSLKSACGVACVAPFTCGSDGRQKMLADDQVAEKLKL